MLSLFRLQSQCQCLLGVLCTLSVEIDHLVLTSDHNGSAPSPRTHPSYSARQYPFRFRPGSAAFHPPTGFFNRSCIPQSPGSASRDPTQKCLRGSPSTCQIPVAGQVHRKNLAGPQCPWGQDIGAGNEKLMVLARVRQPGTVAPGLNTGKHAHHTLCAGSRLSRHGR